MNFVKTTSLPSISDVICAQSASAFLGGDPSHPLTYDNLVTPNDQLKKGWSEYLESLAKMLDDYKSDKNNSK